MALDLIKLQPDGTGKALASLKASAAGPGLEDLYFEVDVSIPHNAVGARLGEHALSAIPNSDTLVAAGPLAIASLFLCNPTSSPIGVLITDGQGTILFPNVIPLMPGETVNLQLGGITMNALHWQATANGAFGALKWYTA